MIEEMIAGDEARQLEGRLNSPTSAHEHEWKAFKKSLKLNVPARRLPAVLEPRLGRDTSDGTSIHSIGQ